MYLVNGLKDYETLTKANVSKAAIHGIGCIQWQREKRARRANAAGKEGRDEEVAGEVTPGEA